MSTFVKLIGLDGLPRWELCIKKGALDEVMKWHGVYARKFFIADSNDPHAQRARENPDDADHVAAALRHPMILGASWLRTAMKLCDEGDLFVNSNGGMHPPSGEKIVATVESREWPKDVKADRRIVITSWGTHFYLVCKDIAFVDKLDTEQQAWDVALQFAPRDNISVKRETKNFKEGD